MALSVTREQLKVYAIQAVHGGAVDSTAIERVERAIETGIDLIAQERRFAFLQMAQDLVTTVPYSTGTVTIPSTTTVEFAGATLPSDIVGQFLEFAGERHWYEIVTRTDDDTLVTRNVYAGDLAAALASQTYRIVYPLIDLPGNFNKLIALIDPETGDAVEEVPYEANWLMHSERAGTGPAEYFSLIPKRNDPNQWQLMLYPAPDVKRIFQIVYYRYPGWYDTAVPATSTWARKAPAGTSGDTYYVDWPDKLMYLLQAAVSWAVAREIAPAKAQNFKLEFDSLFEDAVAADKKSAKPMYLSRGSTVQTGIKMVF